MRKSCFLEWSQLCTLYESQFGSTSITADSVGGMTTVGPAPVTPTDSSEDPSSAKSTVKSIVNTVKAEVGTKVGLYAGIAVGAVVALVAGVTLLLCCCCRSKKRSGPGDGSGGSYQGLRDAKPIVASATHSQHTTVPTYPPTSSSVHNTSMFPRTQSSFAPQLRPLSLNSSNGARPASTYADPFADAPPLQQQPYLAPPALPPPESYSMSSESALAAQWVAGPRVGSPFEYEEVDEDSEQLEEARDQQDAGQRSREERYEETEYAELDGDEHDESLPSFEEAAGAVAAATPAWVSEKGR